VSFSRIGSRAACMGRGCNARLVYGSPIFIEEKDDQPLQHGTVLCVSCATEGAPRDKALLAKAEREEQMTDGEERRAVWLLDQEASRLARAKTWATFEQRQRARDRKLHGSSETEMNREKRCRATPRDELDNDDRGFIDRQDAAIRSRVVDAKKPKPKGKGKEVAS